MPRVSIGLPVYNGERYIEQSVRSVLAQSYRDLELVVADNSSTDRTLEIVDDIASTDRRLRVIRSDANRGAAWNYNRVFEASDAELFRWHAHDDWFEPLLVERLVDALDEHPEAVLAHSWTRFVDDAGATEREFRDDLAVRSASPSERLSSCVRRLTYCNAVFGLVRRPVLAKTALIAPFPGSDVSLLYELAYLGQFVVVPETLYVRRPGRSLRANPTNRLVAEWFAPGARGRRFPGLRQAGATVGAVWRSDTSTSDRLAATAAFATTWPPVHLRKLRRRRARRRS